MQLSSRSKFKLYMRAQTELEHLASTMTDSATGSLNSVVFWETKTFVRRRSAQPFPKGCQLASLSWGSNSILHQIIYNLYVPLCGHVLFYIPTKLYLNSRSLPWLITLLDSKLAVVPKWGDRIAICDFHDDIMTWSFLHHKVSLLTLWGVGWGISPDAIC